MTFKLPICEWRVREKGFINEKNGQQILVSEKPYKVKSWCSVCKRWAYSYNPKLIARHQHIGFCKGVKRNGNRR